MMLANPLISDPGSDTLLRLIDLYVLLLEIFIGGGGGKRLSNRVRDCPWSLAAPSANRIESLSADFCAQSPHASVHDTLAHSRLDAPMIWMSHGILDAPL
jgi:hypothetical protein